MKTRPILIFLILCFFAANFTSCEKEDKNTPPVADFSFTPDSGPPVTVFTFNAGTCSDKEDATGTLMVRWDWENDGTFDTDFSTNKVVSHSFAQVGTYKIVLEVRDSENLGNSITRTLDVIGVLPEVTTDTVTNISTTSAVCGGHVTADFGIPVIGRGVCWSVNAGPTVADGHTTDGDDMGIFTSTLTGLERNTFYYVRAYATNNMGTAYGQEVTFQTDDLWLCGDAITVNHLHGEVAPVSKNVVYGTVSGIPGEPEKCWITSNLGADHQAISVDDDTEASAGWYWQFNRKQGYKHDGNTIFPSGVWESEINEYSDWMLANDPCNLELGEGWRIPAQSEWVNVDMWTNWSGPWNSDLKLHASGVLDVDASLVTRGEQGIFWSNLQGSSNTGWYIRFTNELCVVAGYHKTYGIPIRCIHD